MRHWRSAAAALGTLATTELGACALVECQPQELSRSTIAWQPSGAGGYIEGRVVAVDPSSHVAAARVSLAESERATAAAADGAFRLAVPPGSYTVRVDAPGFMPAQRLVEVRTDSGALLLAALEARRVDAGGCREARRRQ